MKIKDIDIIFICILIIFGKISNTLDHLDILPLYNYKSLNIIKSKYTKITKYLYTSINYSNNLYIILKIPLFNFIYYTNNDLLVYKYTFYFLLNYLFYYIPNEYINFFFINNYIYVIIDNEYTKLLIKTFQIINLDNIDNNIDNNKIIYYLPWMKYISNTQQIIFIIYLCIFSKYNNNCDVIYLLKCHKNLFTYLDIYIKNNNLFQNSNNTKLKIIPNSNNKYNSINFINFCEIKSVIDIRKYLDYKNICKNTLCNILLINNYFTLFNNEYDTFKKQNRTIINNNKDMEDIKYDSIGIIEYNDQLTNDVFV